MDMKVKKYTTCIIEKCRREETLSIEAEKEQYIENLKAHLSEQRHDFFNLLQVLYGYTQLKKPDKVLASITDYCRQMENIGKIYNCKCIKLADLLYTKGKEAESIDLKLEISVRISSDPAVRVLDGAAVLYIIDHVISGFLYALDEKAIKNAHVMYDLRENEEGFQMEMYCREIREGQLEPFSFAVPEKVLYWKKIARGIMSFDMIMKYCDDIGFDGKMLEDGSTFILNICRAGKGEGHVCR